jgi:hypothetical protein
MAAKWPFLDFLRSHLEWVSAKEPTDFGRQAAELIADIRDLAEFDRKSEAGIFQTLLRSTCYQMGTSIESSGKKIKRHQFFRRSVAKTILLERGLSMPEKLDLKPAVP